MGRTWQKLLNQQPGRKKLVNYLQKAGPWVPPSRLSGEMDLLRPQIDEKFGLYCLQNKFKVSVYLML